MQTLCMVPITQPKHADNTNNITLINCFSLYPSKADYCHQTHPTNIDAVPFLIV